MTGFVHPIADPGRDRHYTNDDHDQAADHFHALEATPQRDRTARQGGHGFQSPPAWECGGANLNEQEQQHDPNALHLRDGADRQRRLDGNRPDNLLLVTGSGDDDCLRGRDGSGDEVGNVEARREVSPGRTSHARLVDPQDSGTGHSPLPSVPETQPGLSPALSSRHPDTGTVGQTTAGVRGEDPFTHHLEQALASLRAAEQSDPPVRPGLGTAALAARVRGETLRVRGLLRDTKDPVR